MYQGFEAFPENLLTGQHVTELELGWFDLTDDFRSRDASASKKPHPDNVNLNTQCKFDRIWPLCFLLWICLSPVRLSACPLV